MAKTDTTKEGWWKRLRNFIKANTSLTVIIAAALLLELTTGVMYYSAQNIIQHNMERLAEREMNALYLSIRNKLAQVEVTLNNMAWVVTDDMAEPDSLLRATYQLVEHNPTILGSSISCVPNLFPERGHWFEPYSVRRDNGVIESMQLGSAKHDYTKSEFYTVSMTTGRSHWSEPYLDRDGAKAVVTTYSVPVRDKKDKTVAVVTADISIDWLEDVINEGKVYKHTQRFLVTGSYNLLAGEDCPIYRTAIEQIKRDTAQTNYVILKDKHGNKKHVFYTPVGGMTKWVLINVLDDDEIFSRLRKIRFSLLLPLMIGLFFAGFIVYRSSRNLERLHEANAEKERVTGELRVASEIQQSMLPHDYLPHDYIDICGSLVPAREVGGDLFDYYIRDEKLFFCIGDVSGKGAPSAMVMGVVHSLFRAFSAQENNPSRIMQAINETSCRGNDSCIFVTLFVGVLDLPTGNLRYCDAGHDAPIILNEKLENKIEQLPCNPHLPVGVFDDVKYATQEAQLLPDSTIFLYTDGLTEAKKCAKQLYGLHRTKEVLLKCVEDDLIPQQILEKVGEEVQRFVGDAEQSDDLTMLAIRYTPKQFESKLKETLFIKNDIQEITKLNNFQKSIYARMNIETSLARRLRLAVEEAVVNVIKYAYPADTEGNVEVRVSSDGDVLHFQIIDTGVAFDPTAKEKTDITLSAEDRQIGGLGILLVRELMDSINYERIDGKNILTLIKKL